MTKTIKTLMLLVVFIAMSCTSPPNTNPSNTNTEPETIAGSISYEDKTGSVGINFSASPSKSITPSSAIVEYSIDPALPEGVGLNFDPRTGEIDGIPEAELVSTSYVVSASGTGDYTGTVDSNFFALTIIDDTDNTGGANDKNIEEFIISYTDNSSEIGTELTLSPTSTIPAEADVEYSLAPTTLPEGMSFNLGTGIISGTPKEAFDSTTDPYRVTVTGIDNYTGTIVSNPFTITVTEIPAKLPITGTIRYSSSLTRIGEPVVRTPTSTIPAEADVEYSLAPETLPEGMLFNPFAGIIFGNPTEAFDATATPYRVTVTGIDNYTGTIISNPFTITVTEIPAKPSITGTVTYTSSVSDAGEIVELSPTSAILPANATVRYAITPDLPEGWGFAPSAGLISSGGPADATPLETYRVTVIGTGNYAGIITSDPFTIVVNRISITEYTISYIDIELSLGGSLPSIFRIPTSSIPVDATVRYSLAPATVPDGTAFDPVTGEFSGTPTEVFDSTATPYSVTVTGTDNYTGTIVSNFFTLRVFKLPIGGTIHYESIWHDIGEDVSLSPTSPYLIGIDVAYSVTMGSLPDGLRLDPPSGRIFGNPTGEASANLQITANGIGNYEGVVVSNEFSITITNRIEIGGSFRYPLSTTVLIGDPVNVPISQNDLTPSDAMIRYEGYGDFPAKLSVHPDTGAIEISPDKTITEGTYTGQISAVGSRLYKGTIQSNEFTIEIIRAEIGGSFRYPSSTTVYTHPRAASDPVSISISQNDLTPSDATIRYEEHDDFLPAGLSVHPGTGVIEETIGETTTETIAEGTYTGQIRVVGTGAYKGTIYSNEFTIEINDRIPLTGTIDYTYYPYRCVKIGPPPEDCIDNLVTFNLIRPPNIYPVIATGTVLEAQRNGGLRYITRHYNPSTREFEVWRAFWGLTAPATFTFFNEDTGAFSKDPDFVHARFFADNKPFPVYTFRVTAIGIGAYTGTVSRVINVEMLYTREAEYP